MKQAQVWVEGKRAMLVGYTPADVCEYNRCALPLYAYVGYVVVIRENMWLHDYYLGVHVKEGMCVQGVLVVCVQVCVLREGGRGTGNCC